MVKIAVVVCRRHKNGVGIKAAEGAQRAGVLGGAGKGDVHLSRLQQSQDLVAAAGYDLNVYAWVLAVEAV